MLNQWQFRYLQWTIEKMNELSPMVNPTSFIFNSNPPHKYLIHLTDCFDLFQVEKKEFIFKSAKYEKEYKDLLKI